MTGYLSFRDSHGVAIRLPAGAASSKGLDGAATSKAATHMAGKLGLAVKRRLSSSMGLCSVHIGF